MHQESLDSSNYAWFSQKDEFIIASDRNYNKKFQQKIRIKKKLRNIKSSQVNQ